MARMKFGEAIDHALGEAMAKDKRVVVIGEDVHLLRASLFTRFGPDRVLATPISEAAFVGTAVGAAMSGLRPVVEVMLVDFIGVCLDPILNHAAKLDALSGGTWNCPLVIRAACGGGYGDAGQHEQALWGLLAGIPGLAVVVPSTPADAAGLMTSALRYEAPVVFLEHKLLSETWLEFMGRGGRTTVKFDVPTDGAEGEVPAQNEVPIGKAAWCREGKDVSLVSVGVGVHRAKAAAEYLATFGISCDVLDLRTVRPLDRDAVLTTVGKTGRLVVVDEDYEQFGLSGELAALVLEAGLRPKYARVAVQGTLPYARDLEAAALPNVERITDAAKRVMA